MPGKIVIIGTGVMGGALLKVLAAQGPEQVTHLVAVDIDEIRLEALHLELGVATSTSAQAAVVDAEIVVLAVKPWVVPAVLTEIRVTLPPEATLISIAAGVRLAVLEEFLSPQTPVVRGMPNTPALIGAGITALALGSSATEKHLELASTVLGQLGSVVTVSENSLDAVTGLSGSGPAYVYLFIEALIDAGVREGLSRHIARKLALETVIGSARLVRETGEHPAKLKDAVTTPGGTTIAALAALESGGFRGLVFDAVHCATEVSRQLGKGD